MKLAYRRVLVNSSEAFPKRKYILRPIVSIYLISHLYKIKLEGLMDSGADYTIFPAVIGRLLGINVIDGKSETIIGVNGEAFEVYFHDIKLEIGDHTFKVCVGFTENVNYNYGILGQIGFFENFQVKFNLKKGEIELKKFDKDLLKM